MAYSLADATVLNTPLANVVIDTFNENPLFSLIPFISVQGLAYPYVRTATLGGADFRALNGGYTESTPTFTNHTVTLKFLGGDADVDRALIKSQTNNLADLQAVALVQKANATRAKYIDTLINGAGTSNTFEGIETIIGDDNDVSQPAVGFGTTNDTRYAMLAAVDETLANVAGGATALVMRSQMLAKFKGAARQLGAIQEGLDGFGKTVTSYAGIPLLDAGNDEVGSPIITKDDIYAIRFSPQDGVAGVTNGGIQAYQVGELDAKPSFRSRIEFYCGAVVLHPKAVAILRDTV